MEAYIERDSFIDQAKMIALLEGDCGAGAAGNLGVDNGQADMVFTDKARAPGIYYSFSFEQGGHISGAERSELFENIVKTRVHRTQGKHEVDIQFRRKSGSGHPAEVQ